MAEYTFTGDALEAASSVMSGLKASDTRAVVLITDGVPCTPATVLTCDPPPASGKDPVPDATQAAKAVQQAKALKATGVEIISIAVGEFDGEGIKFIDQISSTPSSKYVFNPSSWEKLPDILADIINSICPP